MHHTKQNKIFASLYISTYYMKQKELFIDVLDIPQINT